MTEYRYRLGLTKKIVEEKQFENLLQKMSYSDYLKMCILETYKQVGGHINNNIIESVVQYLEMRHRLDEYRG